YEAWGNWMRVSPADYERNIRSMIRLARDNRAGAILLYNEIWSGNPYVAALRKVARDEGVPLVDSSVLIAAARTAIERDLERTLKLEPGGSARAGRSDDEVEVVFRVSLGARSVERGVFIVGADPQLGGLVPNKVRMYDDGTHGDQRAGDHVW